MTYQQVKAAAESCFASKFVLVIRLDDDNDNAFCVYVGRACNEAYAPVKVNGSIGFKEVDPNTGKAKDT